MEVIISSVAWIISVGSFTAGVHTFNNTSKIMGILLISNAFLIIHFHNKILVDKDLDRYQSEMNAWESENYY